MRNTHTYIVAGLATVSFTAEIAAGSEEEAAELFAKHYEEYLMLDSSRQVYNEQVCEIATAE